jgi:hypothetical protein
MTEPPRPEHGQRLLVIYLALMLATTATAQIWGKLGDDADRRVTVAT